MGKEGDFRKELLDEIVRSGRKQREAEKVIRGMVDSMKRACVKALHKYINSVVKRSEALLSTWPPDSDFDGAQCMTAKFLDYPIYFNFSRTTQREQKADYSMTRKKRIVKKTGKTELPLDSKSSLETQQLLCDVRFVWLSEGLVDKENCDTSTCDGGSSTVKELMANRTKLAQGCPVFRSMFTSNMRESQSETMIDIVIHNYSYDSFHAFINYLYTGAIKITTGNAVELLAISSEYMTNDLRDRCSSTILSLVDYESSLCQMFDLVGKFDSALEKQLLNLIANHTQTVIQSRAFLELTEESVHLILSNKILAINSEVHLLRAVIAWAHYQLYGTELAIKELALENEEEYLSDEVLSKAEDLIGLIHFDVLDTVYHKKLQEFVGTQDRDRTCLRTVPFNKMFLESSFGEDHWVIKHSASTWRSYPLPPITIKGAQVFALSFTIDECDHHSNVRIGLLSTPNQYRYWFYGYNGGFYIGVMMNANLKFGRGDRVTLLVDHKNQRMALFRDDSDLDQIFYCQKKSLPFDATFRPFVELYSPGDSVRIHKTISSAALHRIAANY